MSEHIPTGFHALTPFLHVSDARGFIAWATKALGASTLFVHEEEDRVVHAEILIEDCILEVSDGHSAWPAQPSCFHLYVRDPDAVFARAIEAGGEQLYEVTDHDYGERSGGVRDPFGNSWYLARVTDMAKRLPNRAQ